jgi:hypothetical protein
VGACRRRSLAGIHSRRCRPPDSAGLSSHPPAALSSVCRLFSGARGRGGWCVCLQGLWGLCSGRPLPRDGRRCSVGNTTGITCRRVPICSMLYGSCGKCAGTFPQGRWKNAAVVALLLALCHRMTQTVLLPDDNPRYLPAESFVAPPFMHVTVVAHSLCLFFFHAERNHKFGQPSPDGFVPRRGRSRSRPRGRSCPCCCCPCGAGRPCCCCPCGTGCSCCGETAQPFASLP